MYFYVALFTLALTVSADDTEIIEKCKEALKTPPDCCKPIAAQKTVRDNEIFKECMVIPDAPGSCERDKCFATKYGFLSDDESIKMDVLQKNLEESMKKRKEIFEVVKEKCIEGDYEIHGDPDDCALRKMANCVYWHHKFGCSDFSDEEQCKGIKEIAKTCKALDIYNSD